MENLEKLKIEREELRADIRAYWKRGSNREEWQSDTKKKNERLNDVHKQIIGLEENFPWIAKFRTSYQVCGWSHNHGYFRNKYEVVATLAEAIEILEKLKKDPSWGIPTLILECIHLRNKASAMTDFDSDDLRNLSIDVQNVVAKHMMGNRKYRWEELLSIGSYYTY